MGHATETARVAAHIRSAVGTTWLGHDAATAPHAVLTLLRVRHLQHLPPPSCALVSRTRRLAGRALWVWSGAVQSGAVTRRGLDRPPESRELQLRQRHIAEMRPCCLLKPAHKVQLDFVRPAAAVAGELGGEAGSETGVEQKSVHLRSAFSVHIGAVHRCWTLPHTKGLATIWCSSPTPSYHIYQPRR